MPNPYSPTETSDLQPGRDAEGNAYMLATDFDGIRHAPHIIFAGQVAGASLDVYIQDQNTEIIDLHLTQVVQTVTLAQNYNVNDRVLEIIAGQAPVVGNTICLKEGTKFYQGEILTVVVNGLNWDVTLDLPLDYAFTTAGGCSERTSNLAVDGSVTPQEFTVSPSNLDAGVAWDITRICIQFIGASAGDDSKFGTMAALANGIVFRYENGVTKNLFSAKTNADLALHTGGDVSYQTRSGGQGAYGVRARRTFSGQEKNGVTVRLNSVTSDKFSVIVQDDLTDIAVFQVVAQGHVVD